MTSVSPYTEPGDKRLYKASLMALDAYISDDPVAAADKALGIFRVPEAYIVKALYGAKNFNEVSLELFWIP